MSAARSALRTARSHPSRKRSCGEGIRRLSAPNGVRARVRWHAAFLILTAAKTAYAAPYTGAAGLLLLIPILGGVALLLLLALSIRISSALIKAPFWRVVAAVVIFSTVSSPIVWPLIRKDLNENLKVAATQTCRQELQTTPGPFLTNGFLDETGGLRSHNIVDMLAVVGFEYVEVKFHDGMLVRASSGESWPAAIESGYARLELGQEDGDCYRRPGEERLSFFTSEMPIKPGVCMKVRYLKRPAADHFVIMENVPRSELSRWVLRDSTTGTVVAGFTDAWNAFYPGQPPNFRGKEAACREDGVSGYATLMGRLTPSDSARLRHENLVLSRTKLQVSGIPRTLEELKLLVEQGQVRSIPSRSFPNTEVRSLLFRRETWREAYALAEHHGLWVYNQNNTVIHPRRSALFELDDRSVSGKWGAVGRRLIKVIGHFDDIVIIVADLEGKALRMLRLQPLQPWISGVELRFRAERFEISNTDLLIHGTYGYGTGEKNLKPWTVVVNLNELRV